MGAEKENSRNFDKKICVVLIFLEFAVIQ